MVHCNQYHNANMMETVNILWTGGWDSTYRILQLSTKNVIIQPYYLKDNRKCEEHELNTINTITKAIKILNTNRCIIKDLITLNVRDVFSDNEITKAYNNILKTDFFGSQYDWLASFAKNIHNLELCIHQDDKAYAIIKKYGGIIKHQSATKGDYYELDRSTSTDNLIKVFGNYHFPLLYYSKLEMKMDAEENGFMNIMDKTWFCHNPINNQPCGICNPCIYTIEEGLEYRFSHAALRRYKTAKFLKPIKKTFIFRGIRKIYKIFRKQ